METVGLRNTFKEKLRPTPAQAAALEGVLWRCRTLYKRPSHSAPRSTASAGSASRATPKKPS